jgi:hypothetical protein
MLRATTSPWRPTRAPRRYRIRFTWTNLERAKKGGSGALAGSRNLHQASGRLRIATRCLGPREGPTRNHHGERGNRTVCIVYVMR